MSDEEQRVQSILMFTFKKLDEALALPGMEKHRKPPVSRRKRPGKQGTAEYPVRDGSDFS